MSPSSQIVPMLWVVCVALSLFLAAESAPADPYCGKSCMGDTECNQEAGCMQCTCPSGHPPPCSTPNKDVRGSCSRVDTKNCGGDPDGPQNKQRTPTNRKLPQYLMIGDSITGGLWPHINSSFYGTVDAVHDPRNAGDSALGKQCVLDWVGKDLKRWDVISYNFGCWDTAWNKGQKQTGVPLDQYRWNLGNITEVLKLTGAKLIYASTTPAPSIPDCCPNGIHTLPKTNGTHPPSGGLGVTDCPIVVDEYNAAAKEVVTKAGVQWLDLHGLVEQRCGKDYTECEIQPMGGGKPFNPHACNVHFQDTATNKTTGKQYYVGGWKLLADAYVEAVRKALKLDGAANEIIV